MDLKSLALLIEIVVIMVVWVIIVRRAIRRAMKRMANDPPDEKEKRDGV